MGELGIIAKVAMANTFAMYFKSFSYHWNIEGRNFSEYHGFFGSMYEELHDAIDPMAEQIRAIDVYAPISIMDMFHFKMVTEDVVQPTSSQTMFANLLTANNQVIESLNKLFDACTAANNQGFANFVADRLDIHAKHGWQLKSFLKAGE